MKILVAVPTFENITSECFLGIYDMDKCGHDVDLKFIKGYDCAKARNIIAETALDGGYDCVLMVDSDTIVPKDALEKLLDPMADIVMGCYPRKANEQEAVLYSWDKNKPGTGFKNAIPFSELNGTERIDVRGGGFGCVLINTEVFTVLNRPYFKYVTYENGAYLSEDLYFCIEAVKAGYRIEADPRVKCGHVSKSVLYGQV